MRRLMMKRLTIPKSTITKSTSVILTIILVCVMGGSMAQVEDAQTPTLTSFVDMTGGIDGQWPGLFGGGQANSHSALKGSIEGEPNEIASYDLRAYQAYGVFGSSEQTAAFEAFKDVSNLDIETAFDVNGIHWKIGDGQIVDHPSQYFRYANLYDGQLNFLYVDESANHAQNKYSTLVVTRVIDANGNREELWRANLPAYNERPHITLADMDGDGSLDIIVSGWWGIVVFDSETHGIIMQLSQTENWHQARKRGTVIASDIDGDGLPEIIIMSIYPWDVNVIDNDGKKLWVKWFHTYDAHIESAWQVSVYNRDPLGDFDADGKLELAYSVWNATGDNEWHIEVRDVLTGEVKHDIPNSYLLDVRNFDGESSWLFTMESRGLSIPLDTHLRVLSLDGGSARTLYEEDGMFVFAVEEQQRDFFTAHGGQYKERGLPAIVFDESGGEPAFFIQKKTDTGYELTRHTLSGEDASFRLGWDAESELKLRRATSECGILFSLRSSSGEASVTAEGVAIALNELKRFNNGLIYAPIIATFGGENRVVISDQMERANMLAFEDGELVPRLKADGSGMSYEYATTTNFGYAAHDLNGDGKNEWLARMATKDGACLRCMDENGNVIWETVFPMLPADNHIDVLGEMSFFAVANGVGRKIVILSGQRNKQHTGITYGLDGATGEILWDIPIIRPEATHNSGAGAYYITIADINGDGVDEIMNGYGNNVWAANVETGEVLFANFMRGLFLDQWIAAYGDGWVQNMKLLYIGGNDGNAYFYVADATNSHGLLEYLYGVESNDTMGYLKELALRGRPITMEMLDTDVQELKTRMVWANDDWPEEGLAMQSLADLRGDGSRLIAEPFTQSVDGVTTLFVRAIDPMTGNVAASCEIGAGGSVYLITCDYDGDGKDEILLSHDNEIFALKLADGELLVQWKKTFAANSTWLAWGDVDGDSAGELVAYVQDGFVRVLE